MGEDAGEDGTGDVVRGGRVDRRSYRVFGLVQFGVLASVALLVALDDAGAGRSESDILAAALLGGGVFTLVMWWWAIPWVASSWVVAVDRDTVRWHGGWRRRDRVIRRADVVVARPVWKARFPQLHFLDAAGERVGLLPLFQFPARKVLTALRSHGWPVHDDVDVARGRDRDRDRVAT